MQVQKISFIQNNYVPKNICYKKTTSYDTVSFSANKNCEDKQYLNAQRYCNLKKLPVFSHQTLKDFNPLLAEGIQKDIPIFDGLNMKEIAFIFNDLNLLAVKRGCSNACLHCFADAKPAKRFPTNNEINQMPFETFLEVTDGLKELKKRMHFKQLTNNMYVPSLFYDADCMDIVLYDKDGKEHDFIELSKIYCDATGNETLFDTAGWNPKNPKMQARAEKYVEQMKNLLNEAEILNKSVFYQVNLSLSPFNPAYAKAIELGYNPADKNVKNDDENYKKGEKLYGLYINRMANMLYTFTPLVYKDAFNIIARPVSNAYANLKEFNFDAYEVIRQDVLKRLEEMYIQDLNSDKKYIKDEASLYSKLNQYKKLTSKTSTNLAIAGRFVDLYKKRYNNADIINAETKLTSQDIEEYVNTLERYNKLKRTNVMPNFGFNFKNIIDTNGKVYIHDEYRVIPTELQLNISTKDKNTPELHPQTEDNFLITREMINKK